MGNLCGKAENVEASGGYRLGSGSQRSASVKPTSSVPIPKSKAKTTGMGKPLGGAPLAVDSENSASLSPREAAARAAEARVNETKSKANKGPLTAKLEAQRRMTNHQLHHDSGKNTTNDVLAWD